MKTINDTVDFDYAAYIAEMHGVTLELKVEKPPKRLFPARKRTTDWITTRNVLPIVTVMGHVDHGKNFTVGRYKKYQRYKRRSGRYNATYRRIYRYCKRRTYNVYRYAGTRCVYRDAG